MYEISVIVPVYNAEKWIENMIKSLTKQTIFEKLEIIFVNDGSKDNSSKIIEKYKRKYKNIILINKENGGVSSARNCGIEHVSAPNLCFVDADDYLDVDYFESLIKESKYDMVASGFIAEYPTKKVIKKKNETIKINNNKEIIYSFLKGVIETNCTDKLFKRELLNNIRFDTSLKYSEDKKFVFEYLLKCNNAIIIPEAKYHYLIHEESATRKPFDKDRFCAINVAEEISDKTSKKYPDFSDISKSYEIDSKCRVLSGIYLSKLTKEYDTERKKLLKDIKSYSIIKKIKYSSKKQYLGFILMKIHPRFYIFFKKNMKLEFANI